MLLKLPPEGSSPSFSGSNDNEKGREFVSNLPDSIRSKLYITVGTRYESIKPVEVKSMVEQWRRGEELDCNMVNRGGSVTTLQVTKFRISSHPVMCGPFFPRGHRATFLVDLVFKLHYSFSALQVVIVLHLPNDGLRHLPLSSSRFSYFKRVHLPTK